MSDKQENVVVIEGTADQEFTIKNPGSTFAANENLGNVKTLERCFIEKIDKKTGIIVDTIEYRIQKVFSTAIDTIFTPKIGLGVNSLKASSERDATNVMANSERGECIGITFPFENISERNNTLHVVKTNAETQNNIPDEVSELSVPGTHFDRHTLITVSSGLFLQIFPLSFFAFDRSMPCVSPLNVGCYSNNLCGIQKRVYIIPTRYFGADCW